MAGDTADISTGAIPIFQLPRRNTS